MSYPENKRTMQIVRCRICHSVITDVEGIYQSPSLYAIACQACTETFSCEDLELMMNLFCLYGGYFGKKGGKVFCLEAVLDSIGNEIPIDFDNLGDINQRVMHEALLYGLGPSDFNKLLREYIETDDDSIH